MIFSPGYWYGNLGDAPEEVGTNATVAKGNNRPTDGLQSYVVGDPHILQVLSAAIQHPVRDEINNSDTP